MYTYQDFVKDSEQTGEAYAVKIAIERHVSSDVYKTAKLADLYDQQRNPTIRDYVKTIFNAMGVQVEDITAANNRISSNFFHRLNTQRCTYSLGNGISFSDHIEERKETDGSITKVDTTKKILGPRFDTDTKRAGYKALIHGVSFGFWNVKRLHVFPVTEFAPLWDEDTGALRAGVRFWRISDDKPMTAILYREDGFITYKSKSGLNNMDFSTEDLRPKPYKVTISSTPADGDEIIGESNYGVLPVVPFWGSDLHQSTLIGMQEKIDSFDLIRSGFANDLQDVSQIYWIIENCGGMNMADLMKLRDRMRITHFVETNTGDDGGHITPYTQEVPYQARQQYLDSIRAGIYEDFGALDVHTVAAGATNDHIDAAYQPMDENADDFEYQVIEFVQQILKLVGIEDTPLFKRNRISNQKEQTDMIMEAAQYLDDETVLKKLPFITVDEVSEIMARKDSERDMTINDPSKVPEDEEEDEEE